MKRVMPIMAAMSIFTSLACAEDTRNSAHLTTASTVRDIVNHPAFESFSERLLTRDDNSSYYTTRLSDVASLMPYHQEVRPSVVVNTLNYMIDQVTKGRMIFYDFYTSQQKQTDRDKENTGLFFFRGKPGAPFAVVCPGGGFSYVGSLHEGFPLALALSEKGYNAFSLKYRVGGEQRATEDLAAALSYIVRNAQRLDVSVQDYSVWGASAGARMAANIGSNGTAAYGSDNLPRPCVVVIQYTGHSYYTKNDPPTFAIVGENDGIASPAVMERRIRNLRNVGIDTEFYRYGNVGHGFGLGIGTSAEGWINNAIQFWEKHRKNREISEVEESVSYRTP